MNIWIPNPQYQIDSIILIFGMCWGHTGQCPEVTPGSHLVSTPGSALETYEMPGIKPGYAVCKPNLFPLYYLPGPI